MSRSDVTAQLGRDVFTTGQLARICHTCTRTIIKWIDGGLLKGWRVPGSKDRRVTEQALLEFADANGMHFVRENIAKLRKKLA